RIGGKLHAAAVREEQNVAVVGCVTYIGAGRAGRARQPALQVTYVEFYGVHDPVRGARTLGKGRRRSVPDFAFTAVIEVDRIPVVLRTGAGRVDIVSRRVQGGGNRPVPIAIGLLLEVQDGILVVGVSVGERVSAGSRGHVQAAGKAQAQPFFRDAM